jgi:hypothetical protein
MPDASRRQPGFALLLGLVWLLTCARLLFQNWDATGAGFPDTDDAMRMVQLRDFLAGHGWFDLHQPRLSPPQGYDSHWSRLVDAGLAGLQALFSLFAAPPMAERLMRAVWPLLWLLPATIGAAAIAWRIAGREAGLILLVLVLACVPGDQQFPPGRIDHHNVQIALTLLVLAATVWSDRDSRHAAAAGVFTALTLAIGFEALPYLVLCGAALSLRFVATADGAAALRTYALALAGGIALVFLATVDPRRWLDVHCDALAMNGALAILAGVLALAVAGQVRPHRIPARALLIALAGAVTLVAVLAVEPRCLKGPYAMVDPRIWPIWLAEVRENQPAWRLAGVNPLTLAAIVVFPLAALVGAALVLLRDPLRSDFGFLTAAAALTTASLATSAVIRASSYAIWFAMPVMAVALAVLFRRLAIEAPWRRAVVVLLLSPLALSSAAVIALGAAGFEDKKSFARADSAHCLRSESYRQLAVLPPGLVVADISHGPFILALTPHSVMAAPYHRLSEGIVAAHGILASPPDVARAEARRAGAAYIALCGSIPPDGLTPDALAASLWARLRAGVVPDWLAPVASGPFTVYRIAP